MKPFGRMETIGNATLYLGDCLEIMPMLEPVDHMIFDPPYEESLHKSKNSLRARVRVDTGPDLKGLDFDSIDKIRDHVVELSSDICNGWFMAFCTIEGVAKWADVINISPMKYKRACVWVKPDCTPQLNGQGPAQGCECFVTAWCGKGHAKWNAGGKRGVYTHIVNPSDRHGAHPTEKPWRLFRELINDFTVEGQTILDPFMGSGTTGIACARTGRKFIGIEKDPKYFDLACERLNGFQGNVGMFADEQPKQEGLDL